MIRTITRAGATFLLTLVAHSADWDSCADDLDSLRRAARDAADLAETVKSAADELRNCRDYPETYDLARDHCRSEAYEYDSAVSSLNGELDRVASRVRWVTASCGMDVSSKGVASPVKPQLWKPQNRMCDLYQSYGGKLPTDVLLNLCMKSAPESECRKCLPAPAPVPPRKTPTISAECFAFDAPGTSRLVPGAAYVQALRCENRLPGPRWETGAASPHWSGFLAVP